MVASVPVENETWESSDEETFLDSLDLASDSESDDDSENKSA
jgi:hypothetical protein